MHTRQGLRKSISMAILTGTIFIPLVMAPVDGNAPAPITPLAEATATPQATPEAPSAILLAAADIAINGSNGDTITAQMLSGQDGTVIAAGDTENSGATYTSYLQEFDPDWGRHRDRILPALGNHEYDNSGAMGYFTYFGAAAGEPGKGYYSTDRGGWHVIVLNGICSKIGVSAGSEQELWLRADLASHPTTCSLAVIHYPLFSSGEHGSISCVRPLWQALYDYGVEIVLSGHDHDYERFAPQRPDGVLDEATGVRQFVVGTGGNVLRDFLAPRPNSQARIANVWGLLKLSLYADRYEWQFLAEPGKTAADAGATLCHE